MFLLQTLRMRKLVGQVEVKDGHKRDTNYAFDELGHNLPSALDCVDKEGDKVCNQQATQDTSEKQKLLPTDDDYFLKEE